MEIKLLIKNGSKYNYIVKESNQDFNSAKSLLEKIVDDENFLYMVIENNSDKKIYSVNTITKELVQILPSIKFSLPDCFLQEKSINDYNADGQNKYFFEKTQVAPESRFPLMGINEIKKFFRQMFENCQIDVNVYNDCQLGDDDFDYDEAMKNENCPFQISNDELEFLDNQIDLALSLVFGGRGTGGRIIASHIKWIEYIRSIINVRLKTEYEFLETFIYVPEEKQQKRQDNYQYGDKYDFGSWNYPDKKQQQQKIQSPIQKQKIQKEKIAFNNNGLASLRYVIIETPASDWDDELIGSRIYFFDDLTGLTRGGELKAIDQIYDSLVVTVIFDTEVNCWDYENGKPYLSKKHRFGIDSDQMDFLKTDPI